MASLKIQDLEHNPLSFQVTKTETAYINYKWLMFPFSHAITSLMEEHVVGVCSIDVGDPFGVGGGGQSLTGAVEGGGGQSQSREGEEDSYIDLRSPSTQARERTSRYILSVI